MSAKKKLYVIKLGETFPNIAMSLGDFEHWIEREAGVETVTIDPRKGAPLPTLSEVAGAIVTGSQSMVTERLPWSERTAQWLTELTGQEVPVLGICYGHQLLAHAHGGEVYDHPKGMEVGTVEVRLTPAAVSDPLMGGLPVSFPAHTVHSQSVRRLPVGAVTLAENAFEPNHAFRLGSWAWGVQFHPEFNKESSLAYVRQLAHRLREQKLDPVQVEKTLSDTPAAASILKRFAQLVTAGSP